MIVSIMLHKGDLAGSAHILSILDNKKARINGLWSILNQAQGMIRTNFSHLLSVVSADVLT